MTQFKFKGTPGPWDIMISQTLNGNNIIEYAIRPKSRLPTLAHVYNFPGQTLANANLIAAAPELLEALIDLAEWGENWTHRSNGKLVRARAAIKKALGEGD